jgi:hypothetical protein
MLLGLLSRLVRHLTTGGVGFQAGLKCFLQITGARPITRNPENKLLLTLCDTVSR